MQWEYCLIAKYEDRITFNLYCSDGIQIQNATRHIDWDWWARFLYHLGVLRWEATHIDSKGESIEWYFKRPMLPDNLYFDMDEIR